jgi:hypothetical protein
LYKRWHEQVALVEKYPLPFVERYGTLDRRIMRFTRRLAKQVNWPLPPPLVGAFSHQYYWTVDVFNIIGVPATEGTSLLGLPDLCHELGHILLLPYEETLLADFPQALTNYIDQLRRQAIADQRPPGYLSLYDHLQVKWNDWWLREFAADMVATYLVGPAFAYQHVRLCAGTSQAVYFPSLGDTATHPADEARTRGIVRVLELLGGTVVSEEVRKLWDAFLTTSSDPKPPDYDVCYPQDLVAALGAHIVGGCREIGLRSWAPADNPDPRSIPWLLVDAWRRFAAEPAKYPEWEHGILAQLWRDLEVG